MRRARKALLSLAVAALVAAPTTPADSLALGGAAFVGTGTVAPGLLPTLHSAQTVSFGGTAVGAAVVSGKPGPGPFGADATVLTCVFSGGSVGVESTVLGQGTVSGGCWGTVTITCPQLAYERIGNVLVLYGDGLFRSTYDPAGNFVTLPSRPCNVAVAGVTNTVLLTGLFQYLVTSMNPTTSYALAGNLQLTP